MKIPSPPPARWTVLIYTSASRDLEEAVEASLEEISQAGVPDSVQVVAQRGRQGEFQRFRLDQPPESAALGPAQAGDMTDPKTLKDFLAWGMRAYPAQRYAVVLGGHAAGFAGALTNADRTRMLPLPELSEALASSPQRPDVLIFNTCLMAQAEALEQFEGQAGAMVASQSKLLGLGLPLAAWLPELATSTDPVQAAEALSRASALVPERAPAVSALDLSAWPALRQAVDQLARELPHHESARPRLLEHIQRQAELWPRLQDRPLVDQLDLGRLCSDWAADAALPESVRARARQVCAELPEVVRNSSDPAGGLSIYAPDRPFDQLGPPQRPVGSIYGELRWAQNTHWDEAIRWLTEVG